VHVRFRTCFRWDGSCACAVVFREGNNVLGINACKLGSPPVLVNYLVDPLRPAQDIQISSDGLVYVVSGDVRFSLCFTATLGGRCHIVTRFVTASRMFTLAVLYIGLVFRIQ